MYKDLFCFRPRAPLMQIPLRREDFAEEFRELAFDSPVKLSTFSG